MIGVAVGVKHGVNFANAFADGLLAEVGRGVDEDGVPVPLHHDRRARAPIVRIGRHAHAAVAADGGHAHRGAAAQNREHCFHQTLPSTAGPPCGGCVSMLVTSR